MLAYGTEAVISVEVRRSAYKVDHFSLEEMKNSLGRTWIYWRNIMR